MTSTTANQLITTATTGTVTREGLVYLYLLSSPFYMFSVVSGRDWPALWVLVLMSLLFVHDLFLGGGWFWMDRSFAYLWTFAGVYLVATIAVFFVDNPVTLLGRSTLDRATAITLRLFFVVLAFTLFVNLLAGKQRELLYRVFLVEMAVGAAVAAFGIIQYVSYVVFSIRALIEIEPTNESYKLYTSFIGWGSERAFRAAGIFHEPSVFGFFLAPLLVKAAVARIRGVIIGNRTLHAALIVLFSVAVLMNLSLTAVVAVGAVVILFVAKELRRTRHAGLVLLLLLAAAVAFGVTPVGSMITERIVRVFDLRDLSMLDRAYRAYTGFQVFLENAWVGVGPGGFAFLYPRYGQIFFGGLAAPLNTWLYFLTDVGILGCIPLVLFIVNIVRRGNRAARTEPLASVYMWSLVAFAVLLSTVDSWFLEIIWFELAMVLAIACAVPHPQPVTAH